MTDAELTEQKLAYLGWYIPVITTVIGKMSRAEWDAYMRLARETVGYEPPNVTVN